MSGEVETARAIAAEGDPGGLIFGSDIGRFDPPSPAAAPSPFLAARRWSRGAVRFEPARIVSRCGRGRSVRPGGRLRRLGRGASALEPRRRRNDRGCFPTGRGRGGRRHGPGRRAFLHPGSVSSFARNRRWFPRSAGPRRMVRDRRMDRRSAARPRSPRDGLRAVRCSCRWAPVDPCCRRPRHRGAERPGSLRHFGSEDGSVEIRRPGIAPRRLRYRLGPPAEPTLDPFIAMQDSRGSPMTEFRGLAGRAGHGRAEKVFGVSFEVPGVVSRWCRKRPVRRGQTLARLRLRSGSEAGSGP